MLLGHIAVRGPDGQGVVVEEDGRVGLAHTRLAIIDPRARSDQPFRDAATGSVIIFNGEIYNFRALRQELIAAGVAFSTEGDTEVILRGFLAHGEAFFRRLRGMYAFAIVDGRTRDLHLLRDPLGIKPLYWARTPGQVVFGSSPQAAAALGDHPLDPAAAVSVAVLGAVIEPLSPFQGVEQIAPGVLHSCAAAGDEVRVRRAVIEPDFAWAGGARDDSLGVLRDTLADSVSAHMTADVPVAILQSAGADSTLISAMAQAAGHRPGLVTIGFEVFRGTQADEAPRAAAIAERLGLEHHVRYISRERFEALGEGFLDDMRTPTGDGFNTYLAAALCRELGFKVALSGVGGDELFAGYDSFTQLPRLRRVAPLARLGAARLLMRGAFELAWRMEPRRSPKLRYLGDYMADWGRRYLLRRAYFAPEELGGVLAPEVASAGLPRFLEAFDAVAWGAERETEAGVRALELDVYMRNVLLRDADWAGMAHGVEVRTPLVDVVALRRLCDARLRCAYTKPDLVEVTRQVAPTLDFAHRAKTGFVVPHGAWSANEADRDPIRFGSVGPRVWNKRVLRRWFGDWVVKEAA